MLIFKCFRNSSLQAFCKIGVLKTSAELLEKHICWSLLSKRFQIFQPDFKLKTASRIFFIFFNELCKHVKNTFLLDSFRRLLLILENLTFKHLILSRFVYQINIVGTLYLMSRNVNFRTSILQLRYYKNNFQPEKFSLDIYQYTNF